MIVIIFVIRIMNKGKTVLEAALKKGRKRRVKEKEGMRKKKKGQNFHCN